MGWCVAGLTGCSRRSVASLSSESRRLRNHSQVWRRSYCIKRCCFPRGFGCVPFELWTGDNEVVQSVTRSIATRSAMSCSLKSRNPRRLYSNGPRAPQAVTRSRAPPHASPIGSPLPFPPISHLPSSPTSSPPPQPVNPSMMRLTAYRHSHNAEP
ncbi:hypothetical protein BDW22DRAFT_1207567 [Trametopsis cervina]|nr:hypothetical protein BDW22DRAFT_1207567 [Trametopsis cervina]